jgi:hypothetical protein
VLDILQRYVAEWVLYGCQPRLREAEESLGFAGDLVLLLFVLALFGQEFGILKKILLEYFLIELNFIMSLVCLIAIEEI